MKQRTLFANLRRNFSTNASKTAKLADITIVGGGPAGLTLLTALKNSNKTKHLNCTLVESSNLNSIRNFNVDPPANFTNRVSSFTPTSVEYLQNIGGWNHINEDRVKFYDNIVAYDGLTDAKINFETNDIAVMCENLNLQSSLLLRLEELGSLNETLKPEILDNTKVVSIETDSSNHWPIVELSDGSRIKTRLLVGADGFNSPVRRYAAIESRGWGYNKFGVVASLKLKYEDFRSVAWQRFLPTGPVALLPLPEDNATLVWSTTPELSELLVKLPANIFVKLLNAAFVLQDADMRFFYEKLLVDPNNESVIEDINWRLERLPEEDIEENYPMEIVDVLEKSRARFPLKMSHADTYVSDRVALVGDAAHTTHPLAGQGLNMGQGDVKSLMSAIEKGIDRGLDIGSSLVLEPYFSERYPENHVLLGIVDKLHKIYSTDFEPIVWLRSTGLKGINYFDVVKDFMVKQISGR